MALRIARKVRLIYLSEKNLAPLNESRLIRCHKGSTEAPGTTNSKLGDYSRSSSANTEGFYLEVRTGCAL